MPTHAKGTFEVTIAPQGAADEADGATLGRMSIEKRFHGDLEGTGKGEMLTAMAGVDGSAGYVAIERFRGTLGGRPGSFVLQHSGTMARGAEHLDLTVVPDSGFGQLVGVTGTMNITIVNGDHFYDLSYSLP